MKATVRSVSPRSTQVSYSIEELETLKKIRKDAHFPEEFLLQDSPLANPVAVAVCETVKAFPSDCNTPEGFEELFTAIRFLMRPKSTDTLIRRFYEAKLADLNSPPTEPQL